MGCKSQTSHMGASILIGLLVTASGSVNAAPSAQKPSSVPSPELCASLKGMEISRDVIAFRTKGAQITSAVYVQGKAPEKADICNVDGTIRPVDPGAPPIKFNVALPARWNGKAMHLMGGGWDGFVVRGASPVVGAEHLTPPVDRGYVAFGSDSGHDYASPDWQKNNEAFENFAGDQLRKTHDAAMAVVRHYYGKGPRLTYSSGGSGGGREALYVADRWPALYDGVIAFYPVWSAVGSFLGWIDNAQALAVPGAWSNEAQQKAISRAVVSQCDALDGAEDGLVADIKGCHVAPESLLCSDPQLGSDTCLSKSQVAGLVNAYGTSRKLPFKLPNEVDSYKAYNVLNGGAQPRMGKTPPGGPITSDKNFAGPNETAFGAVLSDPFVRYVVMRDDKADLFKFKADSSPEVRSRLLYLSRRMDIDPTMKRFFAKGGKVILVHGTSDQVHSADWSDEFYNRVTAAYGPAKGRQHLRYYRIPGFGHGIGLRHGARFDFQADLLTALENWVEKGLAPAELVALDDNVERGKRTRPLCEFPAIPRYRGTGDQNSAASFVCSNP